MHSFRIYTETETFITFTPIHAYIYCLLTWKIPSTFQTHEMTVKIATKLRDVTTRYKQDILTFPMCIKWIGFVTPFQD